ncbi:MAG TPA: pitrilysin family protein [Longimicrobiales bacterium]|nr:pitrilysin family protein [Longimicrobiales bacterium]
MVRRLLPALILSAALLPGALPAQERGPAADLPVHAFTLDNGMRFLVLERRTAPTVAFVSTFPVGGVNERLGSTGTAHLLEHLLFKGSTTIGTRDVEAERVLFRRMDALQDTILTLRGALEVDSARLRGLDAGIEALEDSARALVVPNEFDRILSRNGARGLNATTTSEATTYFVELPANRTELWFALESDRMRDPVFREFFTERDVVMEERRLRVETSPGGQLYEGHLAAAFTMHPYGVPVVGYMSDLESLTRGQVAEYYRRYYGPNNAVVAVVGAVDPDRIEAWARQYFGDLEPGDPPPPVLAREPEQDGVRRVEIRVDAGPALRMGWKVPSATHPDAPALAMLAALLTGGTTAHLQRTLVEEGRVATYVGTSMGPGERYPRLFTVDVTPRTPHTPAEVETAVLDALAAFTRETPAEADLERVRTRIAAGEVRRLQSNLGLALQLAASEAALGDWQGAFRLSDRIRDVTPEEVRDVARRYLRPETLTVAALVRKEEGR